MREVNDIGGSADVVHPNIGNTWLELSGVADKNRRHVVFHRELNQPLDKLCLLFVHALAGCIQINGHQVINDKELAAVFSG